MSVKPALQFRSAVFRTFSTATGPKNRIVSSLMQFRKMRKSDAHNSPDVYVRIRLASKQLIWMRNSSVVILAK
jgi:hypothetical protein